MAATPHNGQIDNDKIYTTKALAGIFGKSDEWVKDNVTSKRLEDCCPSHRVGNMIFISGYNFRLWIERLSDGGSIE